MEKPNVNLSGGEASARGCAASKTAAGWERVPRKDGSAPRVLGWAPVRTVNIPSALARAQVCSHRSRGIAVLPGTV